MSKQARLARLRRIKEKRRVMAAIRAEADRENLERSWRIYKGEQPLKCCFCQDSSSWTFEELAAHVKACSRAPLPRGGGFEDVAAEILTANMVYPTQRGYKHDDQRTATTTQQQTPGPDWTEV